MNGVQLITQAEYARRRGVAKSAVAKAVSENRIRLIDGKIDPAVADIQWASNTRARADSGRPATEPGAPTPPPSPDPPSDDGEYSVNRARRERYEADLAELKLREQQGDLVRVVEVRVEIARRAGEVRLNLLQIPARIAPLLVGETDQARIHALIDGELRKVLSSLTQSGARASGSEVAANLSHNGVGGAS